MDTNPKSPSHWLYCDTLGPWGSAAFVIARLAIGAAFMCHGWPKIHNPMGWMGPDAPVPGVFQALAAIAEFGGGLGLILGCLTRIAAFGIACTMAVALLTVHIPKGQPFVSTTGPSCELPTVYLACAIVFLVIGAGRFSLDALFFSKTE